MSPDILNEINERHKIRVPRPKEQVRFIIGALICIAIGLGCTGLVVGKIIIGEIVAQFYPEFDQQGVSSQNEYPMTWSRDTDYGAKQISFLGGLIKFPVGTEKKHYYFILPMADNTTLRTEVTQKQYEQIGFFDGLCVKYKKGRISDSYYVIDIIPASKNNLKARFWHAIAE
jgi:hypothetical protein